MNKARYMLFNVLGMIALGLLCFVVAWEIGCGQ